MPAPRLRRFAVEFRAAPEDQGEGILEGYASVYERSYAIGRTTNECITRGAFDAQCGAEEVALPLFYEHDWDNPIGVVYARSDSKGVRVRAELFIDANERARSVYLAAKAGALREWSIGFRAGNDDIRVVGDTEHVDRGELIETSIVVRGANRDTEMLSVRAADDEDEEEVTVDQVRQLVAALIYGEANELLNGGQATGAIRALLTVLSDLDWFEQVDAVEDAESEDTSVSVDPEMLSRSWYREMLRSVLVQSDSSAEPQE